jgi:hypothetical protein
MFHRKEPGESCSIPRDFTGNRQKFDELLADRQKIFFRGVIESFQSSEGPFHCGEPGSVVRAAHILLIDAIRQGSQRIPQRRDYRSGNWRHDVETFSEIAVIFADEENLNQLAALDSCQQGCQPGEYPMEYTPDERRRAERYPIKADVSVHTSGGETLTATAVDISSSGMLLKLVEPFPFQLGDEVSVDVDLPNDPEKAFSAWGLARVVRVDGTHSAVQLAAGSFGSLIEGSGAKE